MNFIRTSAFTVLLLCLASSNVFAQNDSQLMGYKIIDGDTVYVEDLPPARIHPKQTMNGRDWRKYYQRVHNFAKSYPYARVVSRVINETDSLFEVRGYNKRKRDKYLQEMKDDVLNDFTPLLRQLTLKQGLMMIRLIDREVGQTPYYIIQTYFNGITAGFWQGVAKMFKGNLKQPYDKYGEDKDLEELVLYWERGEFDDLYMWLFGKNPPVMEVPERFRNNSTNVSEYK